MLKRILGGVAIALGASASASAQTPGFAPPVQGEVVHANVPAKSRGAVLGKPIILASTKPDYDALMPTAADLGTVPDARGPGAPLSAPFNVDAPCDDSCQVCGPNGRVWGSLEYLYWVTSGQPVPVLATAAEPGTAQSVAGILGVPTTRALFGGERVNNDWRNGARGTAGMWLDDAQTCGIEFDFLYLERSRTPFGVGSNGTDIITRPFFNASTMAPDTELVSFPGIVGGSINIDTTNRVIGGSVSFLNNLCCGPCSRTDLILGYRYLNVSDTVTITENLEALPGSSVPAGTQLRIRDQFKTSNNFHGGVIGFATEEARGHFFIGLRATVALGDNYQTTEINGYTTTITPGATTPTTLPGGLLAQTTNIGRYTSHNFAVMPEIGLKFGVQLTPNARLYGGYNFLYLSNVARAGDQIDLRVNTSLLPPSSGLVGFPVPSYERKATDFWMQGVTFGAELRF